MSDRMRVVVWLVVVALCAVFLSQCDGWERSARWNNVA
jgi:hypothetical protein